MPNYCHNSLLISGNKEDMKKFVEDLPTKEDQKVITLDFMVPCPPLLKFLYNGVGFLTEDKFTEEVRHEIKRVFGEDVPLECLEGKLIEKFNAPSGYSWCNANWGVKWDISEPVILYNHKISLEYHTAWCPAIPALEALSERYPNLTIENEYVEDGCGFAGKYSSESGDLSFNIGDHTSLFKVEHLICLAYLEVDEIPLYLETVDKAYCEEDYFEISEGREILKYFLEDERSFEERINYVYSKINLFEVPFNISIYDPGEVVRSREEFDKIVETLSDPKERQEYLEAMMENPE